MVRKRCREANLALLMVMQKILKIRPSIIHEENFFNHCMLYNTNLLFLGTAEIESCMPSPYSSVHISHNVLKISQKFFFISHFFVTTTSLISSLNERETSVKYIATRIEFGP